MRNRSLASLVALGIAVGSAPFSTNAQTCTQVEVHNLRPDQSNLMVAAYADAASFNKTSIAAIQIRASAATMKFPLCGLSGPTVALMLFQDLNGNGKLDRNIMGIPSEPWGATGKPVAMSAPTWETSAVPLDGATLVVNLLQ